MFLKNVLVKTSTFFALRFNKLSIFKIWIILSNLSNRVNQFEEHNKMSLHNLATVFGPTVLRPGITATSGTNSIADSFTLGTIDVMAQAGILYFFLRRKASGQTLINTNCETSCWSLQQSEYMKIYYQNILSKYIKID